MIRPSLEPKQPLYQVGMRLEVIKVQKQSKLNFLQLCKSCLTEKKLSSDNNSFALASVKHSDSSTFYES